MAAFAIVVGILSLIAASVAVAAITNETSSPFVYETHALSCAAAAAAAATAATKSHYLFCYANFVFYLILCVKKCLEFFSVICYN